MNYLAHAYLSFNDPELLVGNMISDFVKGKKQFDYPKGIQGGIRLHRAIDAFTDAHAATREIKEFFRPAYRLYAGAFADVVYDYFLANDTEEFATSQDLFQFTQGTYSSLKKQCEYFPAPFARMFPYMHTQDWLYNYRLDEGMHKSFGGLRHRAAYITEVETAYNIFLANKKSIRAGYNVFMPEIKKFAADKWEEIKPK